MNQVVTFPQGIDHLQFAISIAFYFLAVVSLVFILLFIRSIYKTLRPVSREECVVPKWFLWFLLLPVVGFVLCAASFGFTPFVVINAAFLVFTWILIPFAVPNSLARHYAGRNELLKRVNTLQRVGLWSTVFLTGYLIGYLGSLPGALLVLKGMALGPQPSPALPHLVTSPFVTLMRLSILPYAVLGIIYWCKIVSFRSVANKS